MNRYWREAVGRAGEPRADRKTVPVIGPLYSEANAKRFVDVVEYGFRGGAEQPEFLFSIAPQTRLWGALRSRGMRFRICAAGSRLLPRQARPNCGLFACSRKGPVVHRQDIRRGAWRGIQ